MKKSMVVVLAIVLVLSLMLTACGTKAQPAESASGQGTSADSSVKYKKEVNVGVKAQITTMDVQSVSNVAHNQIFKLTHNTLVDMNLDTGEILPELAESWKWVDDTTIELKLRNDAKFHNGEPVKASDVIFTFKRGRDGIASANKMKPAKEVTAVDDYTVRMVLASPNVDWLDTISLPVFSILSEKAITDDQKNGFEIGSGPWKVNEFVSKDYIALDRFQEYWGGAVPTEKLKIRYIPESSSRVIALQTGEIDLCLDPDTIELPNIESDSNLKLIKYNSTTCQFFGFNCKKAPTDNKLLRQAIAHAINKEDILKATVDGYGVIANSFWGPTQFGYIDGFETYEYDLEKAKKLMAEAGYANGVDLEVTVPTGTRVTTAQILQAQLKEIGVNVIINEVDSAALTSITNEARHQGLVFGLGFNTAGDEVRRVYGEGSSTNRSHYNNAKVIELMDKAVAESDKAKRLEYYKEIQEIAKEDMPVIPLYYEYSFAGTNKNLDGITWYGNSNIDMSGVYVTEN